MREGKKPKTILYRISKQNFHKTAFQFDWKDFFSIGRLNSPISCGCFINI